MSQFNIADAKSHFSELVQKAMLGEEVIIAKDNKPLLKLVLWGQVKRIAAQGRQEIKSSMLPLILTRRQPSFPDAAFEYGVKRIW